MCLFHRHDKPARRPEPPKMSSISVVQPKEKESKGARLHDLIWAVGRIHTPEGEGQKIPAWSGFNAIQSERNLPPVSIRYMPFLRASPTELSILMKLVEVSAALGQNHILVTADMAIYSKAVEILWNKPQALDGKVTMRLGGMHTVMAFIASIGQLFSDSGLLSLLVESGIYAEASARQMLQGKQYARGVRGIKIVFEAMMRSFYSAFLTWLRQSGRQLPPDDTTERFHDFQRAFSVGNNDSVRTLSQELCEDHIPKIAEDMDIFRAEGRAHSATFQHWDDFVSAAQILLHLLRAERDGLLDLHLNSLCEALPWFRAAGRHNYAK